MSKTRAGQPWDKPGCDGVDAAPRPPQLSKKLRSFLDRLGCLSFRSAFASIWRMRSRVTENCWPTSSSVRAIRS